jgi:hypothetical protein
VARPGMTRSARKPSRPKCIGGSRYHTHQTLCNIPGGRHGD